MPVPTVTRSSRSVDHSPGFDDTESMLGIVMSGILEDSYDRAAAQPVAATRGPRTRASEHRVTADSPRRPGSVAVLGLLLVGLLLAWALVQTSNQQPEVAAEQMALVKRVKDETKRSDQLTAAKDTLDTNVQNLRSAALADQGSSLASRLRDLGVASGTVTVTGPGVVVTVDDAGTDTITGAASDPAGRILDLDLQYLVNGLWTAGAEAVSINAQRLTSTTAIRAAGQAITVDYRPLARPYVVRAIGDGDTLQARFAESAGGDWMQNLKTTHGIEFDVAGQKSLTIDGDGTSLLRYATPEAAP